MAKTRAATETSLPVIVWAVFMTVLAIGLGVFVYVLYSDQEKMTADVEKAKKDVQTARTGQAEAEQIALVYKVAFGAAEGEDLEKVAQVKEGDKGFAELKKINETLKKRAPELAAKAAEKFDDAVSQYYRALAQQNPMAPPKLDVSNFTSDPFVFWPAETDEKKQLKAPAGTSLLDVAVKSRILRDAALLAATQSREGYDTTVAALNTDRTGYQAERKLYTDKAKELPVSFDAKIAALNKLADTRQATFQKEVAARGAEITALKDQIDAAELAKRKLEGKIKNLNDDLAAIRSTQKESDPFQYDVAQGKITARPSDDLVEINLGSNAAVTPGLTFTVLPNDFPQKGRQSRMQVVRLPDERGQYRNTEVFVPKATIEVVRVLGPDTAQARITSEPSPVRDRALPGDLLYNSVWRKGQADHIALVGIFDVNGDGTDDIEAVVRDLTKMGIPVDAYFDLKTQKWVGRLTERTRYVVDGYTPITSATDPNLDAKTKMIGAMTGAKEEAKNKGIRVVHFRDFFGRTGYRVKLDVPEDRINQAASKYLGAGNTTEPPPPGNNN